jgi:adenylate cyclase
MRFYAPLGTGCRAVDCQLESVTAMQISPRAQAILIPYLIPGIAILVAATTSTQSPLLAVVALFATPAILTPLAHNFDRLGAKMCEKDDGFMLEACRSGMISHFRLLYRHLPANPRCRICSVPFGGIGRVLRISPSRKNPNFCRSCIDTAPEGVYDTEVGVIFVDIRGFTAWSSSRPAAVVAERISQFYDLAGRVLMKDDALIEFVGDQVMALYLPAFPSLRDRTEDAMLKAAERLVEEAERERGPDPLRFGVGVNFGVASIGNVRKGAQKDFTAVGDVVNTAARLQAAAGPNEIVVAEAVFKNLTRPPDRAEFRCIQAKGKREALPVYVLAPD